MTVRKTARTTRPEVRKRAVRLVLDGAGERGSHWAAIGLLEKTLVLTAAGRFAVAGDGGCCGWRERPGSSMRRSGCDGCRRPAIRWNGRGSWRTFRRSARSSRPPRDAVLTFRVLMLQAF